jgi:FkbH-like protein
VLYYLKKRGIILAIVSKNDEARVRRLWDTLVRGWLRLEDFAIVKINWRPKAENVAEAIAEANILPRSVVFLDDNPTERAAVTAALPEVRAISGSQYEWRRILGWSAELQVPAISDESARRTELIQAQVVREQSRAALTREEFLASMKLVVDIEPVRGEQDRHYPRAFELINKTNQFNTTGQRWTPAEAADYLRAGGVWWTFSVADRLTRYGLVGVACIRDDCIDQFVMSCRVAGLELEQAVLAAILPMAAAASTVFSGPIRTTDANAVVRNLFKDLRWSSNGDGLWRGTPPTGSFDHVTFGSSETQAVAERS